MSTKTIDATHLAQEWLHSHEDDTATTTVYRPASFAFPPSRGRKGFHLQTGGILTLGRPGPTDRMETSDGTWQLSGKQLKLASEAEGTQVLSIESVESDRLVVKKTSA